MQPFGREQTHLASGGEPAADPAEHVPAVVCGCAWKDYTDGILSVYELNRVELLRDVFAWAYKRSSARYAAICRQVGDPDAIRVGYRMEIRQLISGIVTQRMTKPQAVAHIQQWATRNVGIGDRARFVQTVEELLLELNERNIARLGSGRRSLRPGGTSGQGVQGDFHCALLGLSVRGALGLQLDAEYPALIGPSPKLSRAPLISVGNTSLVHQLHPCIRRFVRLWGAQSQGAVWLLETPQAASGATVWETGTARRHDPASHLQPGGCNRQARRGDQSAGLPEGQTANPDPR